MTAIIIPRRWSYQPKSLADVDLNNELTSGITGLWNLSLDAEALTGAVSTKTGYANRAVINNGLGIKATGSALDRYVLKGNTNSPGSKDFTIACLFQVNTLAATYSAVAKWHSAGQPTLDEFFLGAGSGYNSGTVDFIVAVGSSTYTASIASTNWVANTPYLLIGRRSGTTISVFRHNYLTGLTQRNSTTNVSITTINSVAARNMTLGEIAAGTTYSADTTTQLVSTWNRSLSDAEVIAFKENPWRLLKPRREVLYFSTGSGVIPTLSSPSVVNILTTSATPQVTMTF